MKKPVSVFDVVNNAVDEMKAAKSVALMDMRTDGVCLVYVRMLKRIPPK